MSKKKTKMESLRIECRRIDPDVRLEAFCDKQSFYGKAKVVELTCGPGEVAKRGLMSYETLVADVTETEGGLEFRRRWGGWTQTTGRHVRAFAWMFGFHVDKPTWDALAVWDSDDPGDWEKEA